MLTRVTFPTTPASKLLLRVIGLHPRIAQLYPNNPVTEMGYRLYEERLYYILELIEKGRFGSVAQTAKRFSCSSRTVKRMIAHLRERGYLIYYNKSSTQYFLKEGENQKRK